MPASIDTIKILDSDLDFEANNGSPIIISSITAPEVLDSYFVTGGKELKLYKPYPGNTKISFEISFIAGDSLMASINSLIFKQAEITKEFRLSHDTEILKGFEFSASLNGLDISKKKVWLTSFTISTVFFNKKNEKKVRCKLSIIEVD